MYDLWIDAIIPNAVLREDYDRLYMSETVMTHSLKRKDLNGRLVSVINYNAETGRYGVRDDHQNAANSSFSVRRGNLQRRRYTIDPVTGQQKYRVWRPK